MSSEDEDGGFFTTPNTKITVTSSNTNITDTQKSSATNNNPNSNNTPIICQHCSDPEIDIELKNIFNKHACRKCKKEFHKLVTKTTCKDVYLLTDYEISHLNSLKCPNPHKGSWTNMSLFLEEEIIQLAIEKYTSLENLKCIKKERCNQWMEKKRRKVKKIVREYKRKTILKNDDLGIKHEHVFVVNGCVMKCECGLEYEEEEI